MAYPKSLRVMATGAFGSGAGPQVEHPPEEQVPQEPLVAESITTSDFVIAVPFPLDEAVTLRLTDIHSRHRHLQLLLSANISALGVHNTPPHGKRNCQFCQSTMC